MEKNTFDTIFSSQRLQMFKVLFPLLPPCDRGRMAILIRFLELRYTIQYVSSRPSDLISAFPPMPEGAVVDTLLEQCTDSQRSDLMRLRETMDMVRQIQDMMEMADAMKDLFPDMANNGSGMNPMEMFEFMQNMSQNDVFSGEGIKNGQEHENINDYDGGNSDDGALDD